MPWLIAVQGLYYGEHEPLVAALLSSAPVHAIYRNTLITAFCALKILPFRLSVTANPAVGRRKAGRPKTGMRISGPQLAAQIRAGALGKSSFRRILAAALRNNPAVPFKIEVMSNTGGRKPVRRFWRDVLIAKEMSLELEKLQAKASVEPYRKAARLVADKILLSPSSVEAAYDRNKDFALQMRAYASELKKLVGPHLEALAELDRQLSTLIEQGKKSHT